MRNHDFSENFDLANRGGVCVCPAFFVGLLFPFFSFRFSFFLFFRFLFGGGRCLRNGREIQGSVSKRSLNFNIEAAVASEMAARFKALFQNGALKI